MDSVTSTPGVYRKKNKINNRHRIIFFITKKMKKFNHVSCSSVISVYPRKVYMAAINLKYAFK